MYYAALKFDMIKSRRLAARASIQERFLLTAEEINTEFAGVLEAKFVVTHGDEAQALLKAGNAWAGFRLFEYLNTSQPEVSFRCGVGFGTLNTAVQETAIGMDGEAWQNAQLAIELVKRKRQIIWFEGAEQEVNALANLLSYLQSRWTKEQAETIRLILRSHTQKEIAAKLGISNAAVSKRLSNAGWQHYLSGRQALEQQLVQLADRFG